MAQVEGLHPLVFRHLETARDVIVSLDIEVPLPAPDELDQLEESEIVREQFGVADHQQVLLRPRHGHVELAVDHRAIRVLEDVVRQEVQLVIFLDREAIDDVFPLGALITLHRVDRNIVQGLDAVFVDRVADGRDLVPVGNDHTHGLIDIKVFLFDIIDLHDRRGDDIRLHLIDLVRRGRRFRRPGRDKGDASGGQQIHDAIPAHAQGRQGPVLVRAGHFLEGVIIKGIIREEGDVVVHPSLLGEQVSQVLIVSVFLKQSLEQGEAAIRQQDLIQQGVLYSRDVWFLLHHRGQLLVIANQDEFPDGWDTFLVGAQQTDQMRLQDLGSLINHRQAKRFQLEEREVGVQRGCRPHEDSCREQLLP